jgi:hypothetical protein
MEGVGTIVGRKNKASGVFIRLANATDETIKASEGHIIANQLTCFNAL